MKCIIVLSVLVLAAFGASDMQPASIIYPSPVTGSPLLLKPQYVWLESLHGPPRETLHPGIEDSFVASVHASQTSTVRVWFTIDKDGVRVHSTSREVMVLGGDSVRLLDWWYTEEAGYYVAQDSLGDSLSADSSSVVTWRFWVVPWPSGDIAFRSINVPRDTIDTLTTAVIDVALGNYGTTPDSGWMYVNISDTAADRVAYAESGYFWIEPSTTYGRRFRDARFTTLGPHHGTVRFWSYGGSADTFEWDFWVVAQLGLQDAPQPAHASPRLLPTLLSCLPTGAVAFDAMGRKVVDPKPGVYFVREAPARAHAQVVRKVVVQH